MIPFSHMIIYLMLIGRLPSACAPSTSTCTPLHKMEHIITGVVTNLEEHKVGVVDLEWHKAVISCMEYMLCDSSSQDKARSTTNLHWENDAVIAGDVINDHQPDRPMLSRWQRRRLPSFREDISLHLRPCSRTSIS